MNPHGTPARCPSGRCPLSPSRATVPPYRTRNWRSSTRAPARSPTSTRTPSMSLPSRYRPSQQSWQTTPPASLKLYFSPLPLCFQFLLEVLYFFFMSKFSTATCWAICKQRSPAMLLIFGRYESLTFILTTRKCLWRFAFVSKVFMEVLKKIFWLFEDV